MNKSLKWKMAGTYTFIILATLLFFSWMILTSLENHYIESREKAYLTHANIIGGTGQEMLLSGDRNSFYFARDYGDKIDARVLMLNSNGKVIMDSFGEAWLEGRLIKHKEVNSALAGESSAGVHQLKDGKHVLYITAPVLNHQQVQGIVMLVTSLEDIYNTLEQVRGQVILLSFLVGITAVLLSMFLAGVLTKPVQELTTGVEKMTRGEFGVRVPVRSKDEMGRMASAFNTMSSKLERVEKARREFIANVSHEFKSPLGSIKALAQSLLNSREDDPEVYREFLSDIDLETDRLSRLADELMYLVRLEEKGVELKRQEVSVLSLVEHVLSLLQSKAQAQNVELKEDVPEDIKHSLDADLMVRILFNLIDNAIKYSPPRGGIVLVQAREASGDLVLRVQDNGEGITGDDIPYLFNRFYRADKARSRETGGSGLGLSIVKQAVQLHGGVINVESSNKKTVFEITIPKA
ncbi:MAG: cell wall metabolism sensor histidine kinase WalK [Clostridiales bacterium]|nr:cell wall metabolism sensor histidine kinase WalK [Clostridiales bacterium]MCF8023212.1 cell wall metabolism sensor histidine kinase WalK [Clostridiales bacterium]